MQTFIAIKITLIIKSGKKLFIHSCIHLLCRFGLFVKQQNIINTNKRSVIITESQKNQLYATQLYHI